MFRFALSPTGDMRINDLRVALLNYIGAKQANEPFFVRIADNDKTRTIEGKDHAILDILELFALDYSQLYYQSNHFKYHLQFASTLLDKKKAFICFCPEDISKVSPYAGTCEHLSSEEILNNPHPFVIRLKKPDHALSLTDAIMGLKNFEPDAIDSFVIMRTDKYPTDVFACACDDMLQGVTTIIRTEEHLHNAPQEEWIRHNIGYDQPIHYAHVPAIQGQENECTVQWLLDQGFMPEAIANYLLLLGNTTPTEIFTLEEAIAWFDLKAISKSPVHFELERLGSINREHIKRLSDMELSKRLGYACDNIGKLAKIYTEDVSTTYEIKQKVDALFAKKEPLVHCEADSKLLQVLMLKAPYFEAFDDFTTYLAEKSGLEGDLLFQPLRFWLTGAEQGPELALLYPLIKNYLKEIVR